jgi:hypothetical protein
MIASMMVCKARALLAIRGLHVDFQGPPVFIARDALEPFLKGKAATDLLVIERGALRIGAASVAYHAPEAGEAGDPGPLKMVYPNWRRIIPLELSGSAEHKGKSSVERNSLDSRLLERLRVAIGELAAKGPTKAGPVFPMMNGSGPAVLDTAEDTLAILMPMRCGKTFTLPDINAHAVSWSRTDMKPARELPTTPADVDTSPAEAAP